MATKKRRRRRVAVNQMVTVKPARRRRGTRKRGLLGDMMTPAVAQAAGRATINGAVGGGMAAVLERMLAGRLNPFWRIAAPFVAGYAAAAIFKQPEVGAGMAAVGAHQLMKEAGMAENNDMYLQDNNYANQVKQLPVALDVNGQPMAENDDMYLQEEYGVGYAPDFASPTVPATVEDIV